MSRTKLKIVLGFGCRVAGLQPVGVGLRARVWRTTSPPAPPPHPLRPDHWLEWGLECGGGEGGAGGYTVRLVQAVSTTLKVSCSTVPRSVTLPTATLNPKPQTLNPIPTLPP